MPAVRYRRVPISPREYLRGLVPQGGAARYYVPKRARTIKYGVRFDTRERPRGSASGGSRRKAHKVRKVRVIKVYSTRGERDRALRHDAALRQGGTARPVRLRYPMVRDPRTRRWYVRVPAKYVPASLSATDARRQLLSIAYGSQRPAVAHRRRRSTWAARFERRYGVPITNDAWIDRHLMTRAGIRRVLNRGRAAYHTTGSRPNQTRESWARARLASVLLGGPARASDIDIWRRFRRRR